MIRAGGDVVSPYEARHAMVGVGPDLADVLEAARTGYVGPVGPDYTVKIWKDGEWK